MADNEKKGTFPNKATQFSSSNQPKTKGRKKKIQTILKEKGFSAEDVKTVFGKLAWYSVAELEKIFNDDKKPIIVRITAQQFFLALKDGNMTKIREIMDHVIGKAPASLDVTSGGEKVEQVFKIGNQEITF